MITLISYRVAKMIVSCCFVFSSHCSLPFSGIWLVNRVHLIQVVFWWLVPCHISHLFPYELNSISYRHDNEPLVSSQNLHLNLYSLYSSINWSKDCFVNACEAKGMAFFLSLHTLLYFFRLVVVSSVSPKRHLDH